MPYQTPSEGTTMKASEHPKMILRTPPDLREWLLERAERHGWSITSEFINILRTAKKAEEKEAA